MAASSIPSLAASRNSSIVSLSAYRPYDQGMFETRRRSAQLMADPKAQELKHFLGSRHHEGRLRNAAGLQADDKRESAASAAVTVDAACAENGGVGCEARLQWRDEMDRGIRRLMQDTDLMLDDRLHEGSKHGLRCGHLDKTYQWFERHGKKEASKERPAPPFLRYEVGAPVMPGSLRHNPVKMPQGLVCTRTYMGAAKVSVDAPSIMAAAVQNMSSSDLAAALDPAAENQSQGPSPRSSRSRCSDEAPTVPGLVSAPISPLRGASVAGESPMHSRWVPATFS